MSDQLVAEAAAYRTHNKRKGLIFMPSQGFKFSIPAICRSQTHILDRMTTV